MTVMTDGDTFYQCA